jgi:hypothetical protein
MARPAAHSQRRAKIPTPQATVKPIMGVSQAIRRTVLAPTASTSLSSLGFAAICVLVEGKPAYHFADTSHETYRAEDCHQPRACVQPFVQQVADKAAKNYGANQSEWQFHPERSLS